MAVYTDIPQSYVDSPDMPRDFGQLARDNFINHDDRVSDLNRDLGIGPWHEISMQNGWVPLSGYYTPSYRSMPGDRVQIVGGVDGTSRTDVWFGSISGDFAPVEWAYDKIPVAFDTGYTGIMRISAGDLGTGFLEVEEVSGSPSYNHIHLSVIFHRFPQ